MLHKLGPYDFLANLMPGLAFLWAIQWLCQFFGGPTLLPVAGSLAETSILIAWGFLAGLLLQGIAQGIVEKEILAISGGFPSARLLSDGDPGLSPEYRIRLKEAIADYFQVPVEPTVGKTTSEKEEKKVRLKRYQELFYLCYNLVEQKKLSDRPLAFNAQYGLFRGLFTLSLILLVLFGLAVVLRWDVVSVQGSRGLFSWITLFLFGASFISFLRMRKRGQDFARSVYDLFFTYYRQEKFAAK